VIYRESREEAIALTKNVRLPSGYFGHEPPRRRRCGAAFLIRGLARARGGVKRRCRCRCRHRHRREQRHSSSPAWYIDINVVPTHAAVGRPFNENDRRPCATSHPIIQFNSAIPRVLCRFLIAYLVEFREVSSWNFLLMYIFGLAGRIL